MSFRVSLVTWIIWLVAFVAAASIVLYALVVGRNRGPANAKRVDGDPIAVAALNIGLCVMVDTFQTLRNVSTASKISAVRFRGGILTVYLSVEDAELRTLILDYVRERDPNLQAYVIVDMPGAPDPAVV